MIYTVINIYYFSIFLFYDFGFNIDHCFLWLAIYFLIKLCIIYILYIIKTFFRN